MNYLIKNERGVSPVVGVIFMVAVAVIIAATIGSAALGLSSSISEAPPQAQLEASTVDNFVLNNTDPDYGFGEDEEFKVVTITHTNGDNIDPDRLRVTVDGEPVHAIGGKGTDPGGGRPGIVKPWYDVDTISAGDKTKLLSSGTYIGDGGYVIDPVDEHRTVYTPDPSDDRIIYLNDGGSPTEYNEDEGILLESGQTLRVIWEAGDESTTLLDYEIE